MSTDRIELDFSNGPDVSTTLVHLRDGCSDGCSVIRLLAEQIEAAVKPPRIPEPGLWGVVEAGVKGEPGKRFAFVHYPREGWCADSFSAYRWELLIDPTLVRPGIEDES